MQICYMFPGQGTQRAGMLRDLGSNVADVRAVFEAASDVSGKDVEKLCLSATEEELKRTENTQIAVTAMNLAFYTLLQQKGVSPTVVLGHSLGQFSALYAAGVFSLEDTFRLIAKRAELMAGITISGALCTVLGLSMEQVESICKEVDPTGERLAVALHNTETQIVVGGLEEVVAQAEAIFKQNGALRTIPVRVSNAFHTPLMKEMEDEFSAFVSSVPLSEPKCPVLLNCKGGYAADATEIRRDIIQQCCHTVHWCDCLKKLFEQEDLLVAELGIGKVLAGMARSIDPRRTTYLMSNPRQFSQFVGLTTK